MITIIKDFLLQLAFITIALFVIQTFFSERVRQDTSGIIVRCVLLGMSVMLCMSFPTPIGPHFHLDMRIIPLLFGALYSGAGTGLFLSALVILYRVHLGINLGLFTTVLTLLISMPVILSCRKLFMEAAISKRIQIAVTLSIFYALIGMIASGAIDRVLLFRFGTYAFVIITAVAVAFFVFLNDMIVETLRKNERLQSEIRDAEFAFLRSQIKPHFLFNALNSIAALCADEPQKAEQLILDLARYLRSGFDFKQLETLTTLESELELIKAYVSIEQVRFGDRLNVEYAIDANLDFRMPPLLLQPLVENAIRHGLMARSQGGTVKISILRQEADEIVSFAVEDNGCGMSDKKRGEVLRQDAGRKGIGLWNISQRIHLRYGKNVHIESEAGRGTKVFFEIPI